MHKRLKYSIFVGFPTISCFFNSVSIKLSVVLLKSLKSRIPHKHDVTFPNEYKNKPEYSKKEEMKSQPKVKHRLKI